MSVSHRRTTEVVKRVLRPHTVLLKEGKVASVIEEKAEYDIKSTRKNVKTVVTCDKKEGQILEKLASENRLYIDSQHMNIRTKKKHEDDKMQQVRRIFAEEHFGELGKRHVKSLNGDHNDYQKDNQHVKGLT